MFLEDVQTRGGADGLRAQTGANVEVRRARFAGFTGNAVTAGEGAAVLLHDAVIDGQAAVFEDGAGRGLSAFGGWLEAERVHVSDVRGTGVLATLADATFEGSDISIEGVQPFPDGFQGYGVALLDGNSEIERLRVVDAAGGVHVESSAAVLRDVEVRNATHVDGLSGRGLSVGIGAVVELERARVDGTDAFGIFAGGAGASLFARQVVVRATDCIECGGIGLGVIHTAAVDLASFLIEDNAMAGIQIALGGQADVTEGVVRNNRIGVSIDDPDYDIGRITTGVRYSGNETNLDSGALPVPDTSSTAIVVDDEDEPEPDGP